jgi:hypothetical protein
MISYRIDIILLIGGPLSDSNNIIPLLVSLMAQWEACLYETLHLRHSIGLNGRQGGADHSVSTGGEL